MVVVLFAFKRVDDYVMLSFRLILEGPFNPFSPKANLATATMIDKMFPRLLQCILILFTFFLSQNISNAQQQLPACVDFEEIEPGTSGNWVGNNVDDFGVVQNANSGNQFLTASDASGGSGVQGPAPLAGN